MDMIRIGNGAGFWGDNLDAPRRLAESGRLDYLTLEYLAELTLSILAHLRTRDPESGYVGDVVTVLESLVPALKTQPKLKIVTNGGGMHPVACAQKCAAMLAAHGLGDVRIAAVAGDDILPRLAELQAAGEGFRNFDTGAELTERFRSQLASANVYLGARGIVDALADGAQVVITGRVADASLTVGPAVHEFGWSWTDWMRLGGASVAGHLIECGAQATGGMYSAWTPEQSLANLGYPIVELARDGNCVLTKPEGTGGMVTVDTVAEQLVYEIGDPEHYLTPDVDADFSQVTLTQLGPDRVQVSGAIGRPAPERFKVSMAYRDGYMASGTLVVCGDRAEIRARACGELILGRLREAGVTFARSNIECLGTGDSLLGVWPRSGNPYEVVLKVMVHDSSKANVQRFVREFAPLAGSGPGGVTGYTGPRPSPWPVSAYWPATIGREHVRSTVEVHPAHGWTQV